MKVTDVSLSISAVREAQYPDTEFPEIAFVGRSNVGKSSLINNLLQRKKMARTSSVPGKTQTLNFYLVNQGLYFVDVPGFGYARVSKKARAEFSAMIEKYLETRQQLRGVIQLVDARHEPSELDISMYQYLQYYKIPTLVVATKIDKVKKNQWNKAESIHKKSMELDQATQWVPFSAIDTTGTQEIWDWIENKF
ncbi:ribosome biogenesis GTP-binding protein YihA/YsxC [Lacticaseibacillus songhuajiangensis]|jgi:GTP-binding protein|uniref:ribosome biogenesis GTP-binding protein YihA/YsxC n=1 Tax=Lacticaseibacillus songhuajiangensis TaxID=1296539 RepID=UPI000F787A3D|nr:ribosome biogenesis GTP-binding protein YihA/YsxC [Lacticaseibacillus songhuajiangensis]MCI1283074.1 ribosome biogenesis GTP-binding protein YihA/YsxC [Lacticaseibacillus songhuajiangensis]